MVKEVLDKYAGIAGHVSDEDFAIISELLERNGEVVQEIDVSLDNALTGCINTIYIVEGTAYNLWYTTRTPKTPEGVDYVFGFDKAAEGVWLKN